MDRSLRTFTVQNAVKHSQAEQVVVRLTSEPERITLTIRDNGKGMPRRADSDKKGRLGLHIMQYRAGLIGGTFDVRNGDGGGTQVRCTIPT
jgi:signal transduction histidine kinase